ncbi:DUF3788 domain-containing protein [Desnuesiella massiliensis]|uniref:DUF3788 domain-containing protein n=1 Tax=Desnuesiella massiliensis TaxID=1650662 RepID=UPI0006E45F20|nr:DUF3788 domain-containing protein [Desnuesiella massiliensis]
MLEKIPSEEELISLMGENIFKIWCDINNFIKTNYNIDFLWDKGGKSGVYELKYRKSGKTLCALYAREQEIRILVIFGKVEREKFEASRADFSKNINEFYDSTHQYHDGKWLYINLVNSELVEDIKKLILIKKKPNKKLV